MTHYAIQINIKISALGKTVRVVKIFKGKIARLCQVIEMKFVTGLVAGINRQSVAISRPRRLLSQKKNRAIDNQKVLRYSVS